MWELSANKTHHADMVEDLLEAVVAQLASPDLQVCHQLFAPISMQLMVHRWRHAPDLEAVLACADLQSCLTNMLLEAQSYRCMRGGQWFRQGCMSTPEGAFHDRHHARCHKTAR